jgi:formylmethanofuran dehydrogenase subunit E
MRPLDELLEESVKLHGHLCPGQVLGVRLAMLGCQAVGLDEPREGRRLLVFVEIDRCATDAIQSVTGCSLGKRTLRHVDYGKTAATFVNTRDGESSSSDRPGEFPTIRLPLCAGAANPS